MQQQLSPQLQHHLMLANLFFTLAKRYEYVDPAKHMHYYEKYFEHVQHVERLYLGMGGSHGGSHWGEQMSSHMDGYMNWP